MAYMNNSVGYLSEYPNHFCSPMNMKTYTIKILKTINQKQNALIF